MKSELLLIWLFIICSCNDNSQKNDAANVRKNQSFNPLSSRLLGKWGAPGENPFWDIRNDSIYYYNKQVMYPYFLKGDTFLIKFPDRDTATVLGKISISGDTLKLRQYYANDFIIHFYRFKE